MTLIVDAPALMLQIEMVCQKTKRKTSMPPRCDETLQAETYRVAP